MLSKKQQSTKRYWTKRENEKDWRDQEKEELKQLTKILKQMSHQELLTFLETKYDKYIKVHPTFQQKMNYTIAGTIKVRTLQFQQELKDLYLSYIFQNWGKRIDDREYQRLFITYALYRTEHKVYQPHDCRLFWTNQQDLRVLNMQGNISWGQNSGLLTKFIGTKIPKNLYYQIDMRRAKKGCVERLQEIISYKNKIYKIVY